MVLDTLSLLLLVCSAHRTLPSCLHIGGGYEVFFRALHSKSFLVFIPSLSYDEIQICVSATW